MKKIISSGLAAILAVSALSATASAALTGTKTVTAKGAVNIPTIKVDVPSSMGIIVNPYELEIDKTTGKAATATTVAENKTDDKIIGVYGTTKSGNTTTANDGWTLKNTSGIEIEAKIAVGYTVKGNVAADTAKVYDTNATGYEVPTEEKYVSIGLAVESKADDAAKVNGGAAIPLNTKADLDGLANWAAAIEGEKAVKVVIGKVASGDDADNTALIKVTGDCYSNNIGWNSKDSVDLAFVFDFSAKETATEAGADPDPNP